DPARLLEFEIRNFASNVVDLNQPFSLVRLLLGMAALALIACSVYRLIARGPRRAAVLLTLLIVVPALPIMLLDFTAGGIRSIIARYFLPCNLAFVLALAFTLGNGLQSINRQERRRWAYLSIFAIAAGLCSCAQIAATPVWWNKAVNRNTLALASCVNSLQNPLVITNYSPEDVDLAPLITLSYFLNPNSSLELRRDDSAPEMASGYSDYILFMPTKKFRTAISHAWRATVIPIGPTGELWQIIQKNGAAPRIGTFPHLQPPPGGMYGGDPRAIPRVVPFPSGDGSNRLPGGIQHGVPNGAPRSPAPPGMTPGSVPLSPQNEI
ncbi:MAG TPA: hypothetical protein V6C72_17185, partial [Chroococcales cyanobacterium]